MNSNYDYIHAADVSMSCKLCSQLLNSPRVLRCGHIYCENCILAIFNASHTCPECAMPAHSYDISSCPLLDNILSVYSNYKLQFVPSSSSVNVEHTISTANHDITNQLPPSFPLQTSTDHLTAVKLPPVEYTKSDGQPHEIIADIANEAYIDPNSIPSLHLAKTVLSPVIGIYHSNLKEPAQSTDTASVDEAHQPTENDEASIEIFLNLLDSNEPGTVVAEPQADHNSTRVSATLILTQDSHAILPPHANEEPCNPSVPGESTDVPSTGSDPVSQMLPDSNLEFSLEPRDVHTPPGDIVLGESCSSVINKVCNPHLFLHIYLLINLCCYAHI